MQAFQIEALASGETLALERPMPVPARSRGTSPVALGLARQTALIVTQFVVPHRERNTPPVGINGTDRDDDRDAGQGLRQTLTELLPRLRRFGLSLTGSSSDADDLVQNVCERVLMRCEQLRDRTRLDAWLFGIMRNLWIDELRRRRIRRHEDLEAASDVMGDHGQAVVDSRITLAAVRRIMQELPEDQRTLLMLICVDGLSYKETAEALGIPLGTVMSRLSRARQALQDRLAGVEAGKRAVAQFPTRAPKCRQDGSDAS